MSAATPPRMAVWLLRLLMAPHNRDFIIDDLSEEFVTRVRGGKGMGVARFWFWGQVGQCLVYSLRRGAVSGFALFSRGPLDVMQDIRLSIRSLRKSAGFATVAVLTLALGIGANTAVFTVVNGVLLKPLPYPEQERLVTIWSALADDSRRFLPSYPDYLSWHEQATSFETMAFVYGDELVLRTDDGLEPILSAHVSGEFFSGLGGRAILGTPFGDLSRHADGEDKQVVLKYGEWQGRFGGDPDIVGKTISFTDGAYTVVAVMEEGVDYPFWANIWTPLTPAVVDRYGLEARDRRIDTRVLARLAAGVSQDAALAELTTVASRLAAEYPATNDKWTVRLLPLKTVVLDPWGQNENLRRALYVLMGAVGLVLLIACANLANLMLARVAIRGREMAVRSALGAGKWRMIRQALTESMVLSLLGAAVGTVVAHWGVDALLAGAPQLPRVDDIGVDKVVLAYTSGIAILTALLFGITPALRTGGGNLVSTLKDGGRTSLGRLGTKRMQLSLVVSQVSLAVVLLIGAGLLGKSLRQLAQVNLGFDTEHLTSVRVRPPQPQYADARIRADLYRRLVDAVAATPGVESASLVNHIPGGGLIFSPLRVEGLEEESTTGFKTVAPGYFETMGIAVVEGRSFTDAEMVEQTDGLIVNRSLAQSLEIGLGRRITVFKQVADQSLGQPISGQVIGIVGATRTSPSQEVPLPDVFVPYTVNPWMHATVVARTRTEIVGIGEQIREAVLSVEPDIPGVAPWSVASQMYQSVSKERFAARLMSSFAAAALLLSAVGIYGVMAYLVRQRSAEIGLRMAMGATARQVLRLVVGRAMWMVLIGAVVGLAASVGLTRFMTAMLFGVNATDLLTYATVCAVIVVVALAASYLPAHQAANVDPLKTLRAE